MAVAKDFPLFQVLSWHSFDQGHVAGQFVRGEFELQSGDRIQYEAGQNIHGIAEVVEFTEIKNRRTYFTMKKIS